MKVAILSDCYLPRLGGIEVQVHDLATRLVTAGHAAEVFTATAGPAGERGGHVEVIDGVRVHRMAIPLPGGVPVNPLAPPEVARRLREGGFDVAHVQMGVVSPFATDMARVALSVGLPTAVTWHCVLGVSRPLFAALGSARRWARSGAALSAVSSMAAARVADIAGGADVRVLGDGIDAARWAPSVPRMPSADGVVRVTSALRLARRKRPGAIVDVLDRARRLLPADVGLEAHVFGDGPQRPVLQSRLRARGMSSWVHLRGRVSREELREAHHGADAYLSPARLEAFGIAALEARTAGLPVVARAGTGVEDFVTDGVGGLLADDDEGLARALVRLATDTDLRVAIARHNATVPPPQDWPAVVEATLAEYRRAGAP
ncbi:N-acetylglucosaminyl-phosphatidylinositol biosynthetic protein [Nostocoides japonicum T1-X7]|uniref:D-inositol 3-phosphate glycosyltransferase n=1 Tax=Nostocoides japonicum T1-X7 TaxID=1194083 RepID=A0A077LWS3_9MICO|nr:glycosyltransferase family 4 protein [Tetrasphaera japonica]CCH76454.1 N-acetylglucosaminyl-phosphatidylinositol biosynthetic protein [Tetrasphaera japonica T1-X7]